MSIGIVLKNFEGNFSSLIARLLKKHITDGQAGPWWQGNPPHRDHPCPQMFGQRTRVQVRWVCFSGYSMGN